MKNLSDSAKLYLKSLVKTDALERERNGEYHWAEEINEISKELNLEL